MAKTHVIYNMELIMENVENPVSPPTDRRFAVSLCLQPLHGGINVDGQKPAIASVLNQRSEPLMEFGRTKLICS